MRIGILTGGGDVPGLNPCIKAVVNRVAHDGHEVVGLRRGWAALLQHNPDDPASAAEWFQQLTPSVVRTIDRTGGTFLHTSRTNPSRVRPGEVPAHLAGRADGDGPFDFTDHALRVVESLGIDVLIPIGGDDTLSYALRMHDEGVPVIAIPKTMDNDVHGTDYCIGFSTAVTRGVQFIHNLRTSTGSHERIAVVELFGRYSGETSLDDRVPRGRRPRGDLGSAVRRRQAGCAARRRQARKPVQLRDGHALGGGDARGRRDGALRRGGRVRAPQAGRDRRADRALLKERTGEEMIVQEVGYLMRSGAPDSLDLMVATNYAVMAADLALEGASGRMVALRSGTYTAVPISATREGVKRVDVDEFYDTEAYRPKVRHVAGKPMFLY